MGGFGAFSVVSSGNRGIATYTVYKDNNELCAKQQCPIKLHSDACARIMDAERNAVY